MTEVSLDLASAALDHAFLEKIDPLMKLRSCVRCGTCSATCPTAFAMDFTPRQLWRRIQLGLRDEVLNSRTFWLCTTCKACQVRCPRGIDLMEAMIALKEYAFDREISVPEGMVTFGETIGTNYNISGDDNVDRQIWSQNLSRVPLGVAPRRKTAEVLYFIGCVSSFYPRVYTIPQSFVQIMERAGVEFTTLGGDEWCCGYPLHIAGMSSRMADLARHNVEMARAVGAKKVVFSCPSCYYAWAHLYPEYANISGIQLQHAAEFMTELLADGSALAPVEEVVTYHDPCDLGRKSEVYDAPREILARIPGLDFREMSACRENALCCGGGGDVEVADRDVPTGVAGRRVAQVQDTGARYVVSACQQCKRTLQEGARLNKVRVRAMDLTELVWQSMRDAS
jgi:heterodisulfide reductase subunit D